MIKVHTLNSTEILSVSHTEEETFLNVSMRSWIALT